MDMGSFKLLVAGATATALLVTGCSDDPKAKPDEGDEQVSTVDSTDEPTPTETAEEEPDLPSNEEIEQLLTAISTGDVLKLEVALDLVKPGSLAHAYTSEQLALANAYIDAGQGGDGSGYGPLRVEGNGWQACPPDSSEFDCTTWADVTGSDGKVTSFTINGVALGSVITAGNGKATAIGPGLGSLEMLFAYQSPSSGYLFVIAKASTEDQELELGPLYSAAYRDPSGRQFTSESAITPTKLGPKSTATVAVLFPPPAKLGGTVSFEFYDAGFNPIRVELKTK